MRLPKARPPKRYSRSVETTTRLLHVTAPLSCWHVLAVRLQIQNLVGGRGFEPGASRSRTSRISYPLLSRRFLSCPPVPDLTRTPFLLCSAGFANSLAI